MDPRLLTLRPSDPSPSMGVPCITGKYVGRRQFPSSQGLMGEVDSLTTVLHGTHLYEYKSQPLDP